MKKTDVYVVVDTPKKANYCTIQLTQGKYTIVDSDDFDLLNRYNWHFQSRGYACNEKLGLLHRFITNCPKGMVVDHINGDKLDNRKENLRICTQTQNTFNSKGVDNKTSKYKGVSWAKIKNKWKAQIHINKKNTYLGLFDSEIDAAKKYDEIAYSLYGDFAKLNFIRYATEEEKSLLEPKKELDVGKWYRLQSNNLVFTTSELSRCHVSGYGFSHGGKLWSDEYPDFLVQEFTEATRQEVEQALIKEAKRRGFVNGSTGNNSNIHDTSLEDCELFFNNEYEFDKKDNLLRAVLDAYTTWTVFKDGKWATIIEQDKFAELKEAHRNGSMIQMLINVNWIDVNNPLWDDKYEYRIKPSDNFTNYDVAIVERLHDTLLDNHGYSLESKLLTDARLLSNKIKSNIK